MVATDLDNFVTGWSVSLSANRLYWVMFGSRNPFSLSPNIFCPISRDGFPLLLSASKFLNHGKNNYSLSFSILLSGYRFTSQYFIFLYFAFFGALRLMCVLLIWSQCIGCLFHENENKIRTNLRSSRSFISTIDRTIIISWNVMALVLELRGCLSTELNCFPQKDRYLGGSHEPRTRLSCWVIATTLN